LGFSSSTVRKKEIKKKRVEEEDTLRAKKMADSFISKLDKDGDGFFYFYLTLQGSITFDEFGSVMKAFLGNDDQIRYFWRKLLNGAPLDKQIDADEFLEYLMNPKEATPVQEATWWFLSFDPERHGKLSKERIADMASYIDWLPEFETNEKLYEFFQCADKDTIGLKEFVTAYRDQYQVNLDKINKNKNMGSGANSFQKISNTTKFVNLISMDEKETNHKMIQEQWNETRSVDVLELIYKNMQILPVEWTTKFVQTGGMKIITDAISTSNVLSDFHSNEDLKKQHIVTNIIYFLLQTTVL
jgi:Ca2+-binding EF-hand superfamily protein